MRKISAFTSRWLLVAGVLALAVLPSCGGGKGGAGPNGAGQGLILVSFLQEGVDNIALNTILEWRFSEPVLASSINTSSIQIRRGPAFGQSVPGTFRITGSTVTFEPQLPGLCDLSDAGFDADTQYRVQLIGFPEEFAILNTKGQPLNVTTTYEFHTRTDTDPERFADQIPGFGPSVILADTTPTAGDQALTVGAGNEIRIRLTENVDPCTIDTSTVRFEMFESGDPAGAVVAPNGNISGFYSGGSTADADPSLFSWGADVSTPFAPAQRVLSTISLVQTFARTEIVITPNFGQFPENALLVVQLTSGIEDFGGQPMSPFAMSFTTENLPLQNGVYSMLVDGETPFLDNQSTADVNTARAPSRVQGYLLFAGDGDNGLVLESPSGPDTAPGCAPNTPLQVNDGNKDNFEPDMDLVLNTGATLNTCTNQTDGSTAVVYEFNTFRIPSGVTVRVSGVNPLIILVQGDILIENGGRLLLRGDGTTGVPQGNGSAGRAGNTGGISAASVEGEGVAGGGDGGHSHAMNGAQPIYGTDGLSGIGTGEAGTVGGLGAGHGNTETRRTTWGGGAGGSAPGGGGGGHAEAGGDGQNVLGPNTTFAGAPDGVGGQTYPAADTKLLTPSAGSGGGAGGACNYTPSNGDWYNGSGGAGGAGGGFVDLTGSGNISIFGTLDAAGGRGGAGIVPPNVNNWHNSAGGGGGSGGGIRLLTPNDISVTGGTITASGGAAGITISAAGGGPPNAAGPGGNGRVVMEDGDSVITGLGTAAVTPGEGATGFFRSAFDAGRFQGGGTMPQGISDLIAMGPLNPDFVAPVQADFVATIPAVTSNGFGSTSIFIEARGFDINPDGTPGAVGSPWRTIGYFRDSGTEDTPTWVAGANPGDVAVPGDNAGGTITSLDGFEFLQLRITFYLPNTVGPFDPGPSIDRWDIRFTHDQ